MLLEEIKSDEINLVDLFYMADECIKFGTELVPFHATCLHSHYDIIYDLLIHIKNQKLYDDIKYKLLSNGQNPLININDEFKSVIGISSKTNLLNKYSFCNKLMELFDILYDKDIDWENASKNDEIGYKTLQARILSLFNDNRQSFINFSDMMEQYSEFTNTFKFNPSKYEYSEDQYIPMKKKIIISYFMDFHKMN